VNLYNNVAAAIDTSLIADNGGSAIVLSQGHYRGPQLHSPERWVIHHLDQSPGGSSFEFNQPPAEWWQTAKQRCVAFDATNNYWVTLLVRRAPPAPTGRFDRAVA